ncbi:MAG: hypothetical protein JRE23_06525 [Deltaproteobacteria bacterium]|nr:hypothetical protein [Deltaproteobacteria bacterium]
MKLFLRLMVCCILFGGIACGKKGPPVPPKAIIPQSVKDLKGEVIEERIRLSWTIPEEENLFKLFKAIEPLTEEPCPDCPVRFTEVFDIDTTDSKTVRIEGKQVIYWDSIEAGNRYVYKVIVISEDGVESGDSNIVRIPDTD